VTATADTVAVGADPRTFNVTGNDSGGSVAILAAPPGVGVTGFGFDGTVSYAPRGGVAVGGQLSYLLFGPDGVATAAATADMVKPNLEIYNGQDGKVVRDEDETKIGAFTVVNKNDTDGDGLVDNADDQGVHAADGVGANEMDLMRLRVNKPTGFGANDTITVAVTHGAARFFGTSLRENNFGQTLTLNAASFTDGGQQLAFRDYWVEVYDTAAAVRDIEITMTYQGQSVKVNATGVWVNFDNNTGFHANGERNHATDADDPTYDKSFQSFGSHPNFQFGQPPMLDFPIIDPATGSVVAAGIRLMNAMEIKVTPTPAGIGREPGIRFDISRSVESRYWEQRVADPAPVERQWPRKFFPVWRERANDDGGTGDEDNAPHPTTGNIYVMDWPGTTFMISGADYVARNYGGAFKRFIMRMNAQEFVRIHLDNSAFSHDPSVRPTPPQPPAIDKPPALTQDETNQLPYQGSRTSELIDWRSWMDFQWNGTAWVRTTNAGGNVYNEMTLGGPHDLGGPGF
jgi:hypothetical protein